MDWITEKNLETEERRQESQARHQPKGSGVTYNPDMKVVEDPGFAKFRDDLMAKGFA